MKSRPCGPRLDPVVGLYPATRLTSPSGNVNKLECATLTACGFQAEKGSSSPSETLQVELSIRQQNVYLSLDRANHHRQFADV